MSTIKIDLNKINYNRIEDFQCAELEKGGDKEEYRWRATAKWRVKRAKGQERWKKNNTSNIGTHLAKVSTTLMRSEQKKNLFFHVEII